MPIFKSLIEDPPLHSLVIHFEPEVAAEILKVCNHGNRRMIDRHALRLAKVIKSENYELTGDTIKFSELGRLLDGQHRLNACVKQGSPIISHVIFGLKESVFDVIDQGKKRNAADILGLVGIEDPNLVAGAVRFVMWYRFRTSKSGETDDSGNVRKIREAAEGPMREITHWTKIAREISKQYARYRHQPSIVTGLLFLIGKYSKPLATEFAEQWLHGNRQGRNKGFDNMHDRIIKMVTETAGGLSGEARAAMLIQLFNNWNADISDSHRTLTWRKEWRFPVLEFDAKAFKANKDREPDDYSLPAQKF